MSTPLRFSQWGAEVLSRSSAAAAIRAREPREIGLPSVNDDNDRRASHRNPNRHARLPTRASLRRPRAFYIFKNDIACLHADVMRPLSCPAFEPFGPTRFGESPLATRTQWIPNEDANELGRRPRRAVNDAAALRECEALHDRSQRSPTENNSRSFATDRTSL